MFRAHENFFVSRDHSRLLSLFFFFITFSFTLSVFFYSFSRPFVSSVLFFSLISPRRFQRIVSLSLSLFSFGLASLRVLSPGARSLLLQRKATRARPCQPTSYTRYVRHFVASNADSVVASFQCRRVSTARPTPLRFRKTR